MTKKNQQLLVWSGVGALILIVVLLLVVYQRQPAPLDSFAQCLDQQGAKFYGSYDCIHCQNQKQMFGRAERHLPYVECKTPSGQSIACNQQNIQATPTWIFSDGERQVGTVSLEQLAEKTGCELPDEY